MNIKIVPADPKGVRGMQEVYFKTWLATYPNKEAGVTEDDVRDFFKDDFTEEELARRAENLQNPAPGKRWSEERFRFKSGAIITEMEMILKSRQNQ